MKTKSISLIFELQEAQIKDAKTNGDRRTQESLSIGEDELVLLISLLILNSLLISSTVRSSRANRHMNHCRALNDKAVYNNNNISKL